MAAKKETIYIKADRNVEVTHPDVSIGEVVQIECVDPAMLARVKSMRILKFQIPKGENQGRAAVSILKIIALIHEVYPDAEIQNMGETDFIVTYEEQSGTGGFVHYMKIIFVVIISFMGAAFSTMTFNNDVNIKNIFSQIYETVTGVQSDGFTVIELTYSIGITIGILIFFNHFGKKRFTVDPTPIEVEMRLYENDLQTTLIENYARREQELDVDTKPHSGSYRT